MERRGPLHLEARRGCSGSKLTENGLNSNSSQVHQEETAGVSAAP